MKSLSRRLMTAQMKMWARMSNKTSDKTTTKCNFNRWSSWPTLTETLKCTKVKALKTFRNQTIHFCTKIIWSFLRMSLLDTVPTRAAMGCQIKQEAKSTSIRQTQCPRPLTSSSLTTWQWILLVMSFTATPLFLWTTDKQLTRPLAGTTLKRHSFRWTLQRLSSPQVWPSNSAWDSWSTRTRHNRKSKISNARSLCKNRGSAPSNQTKRASQGSGKRRSPRTRVPWPRPWLREETHSSSVSSATISRYWHRRSIRMSRETTHRLFPPRAKFNQSRDLPDLGQSNSSCRTKSSGKWRSNRGWKTP